MYLSMLRPLNILSYFIFLVFLVNNANAQHYRMINCSAKIDTMCYVYVLPKADTLRYLIPQIRLPFNSSAEQKINARIRQFSPLQKLKPISVPVVKPIKLPFEYNSISSAMNYLDHNNDSLLIETSEVNDDEGVDSHDDYYENNYLGESFFSLGYQYQVLPFHGQYQFFYTALNFDLRTGDTLSFSDFFDINQDTLVRILQIYGQPIDRFDQYKLLNEKVEDLPLNEHISELYKSVPEDDRCTEFFFANFNNEVYLCFKLKCCGPQLFTLGINLSYLKPYIIFPEFKNKYFLWGNDINDLSGKNIANVSNYISFSDYQLNFGGGYKLEDSGSVFKNDFYVLYANNDSNWFYLLVEKEKNGSSMIVKDLLKIKKEIGKNIFMRDSYCYLTNRDVEVIAKVKLINNKRYVVQDAWRANRSTCKFEMIDAKKVLKCDIEND